MRRLVDSLWTVQLADNDERLTVCFDIQGATAYGKECETAKSGHFPALGVPRKSGLPARADGPQPGRATKHQPCYSGVPNHSGI